MDKKLIPEPEDSTPIFTPELLDSNLIIKWFELIRLKENEFFCVARNEICDILYKHFCKDDALTFDEWLKKIGLG